MKSMRLGTTDPARWYAGDPGSDEATVVAYGARTPAATFDQFKLEQAKAVALLRAWMAKRVPTAYRAVMKQAPHMLDPDRQAVSGLGQDPYDIDLYAVAPGAEAVSSSTGAIQPGTNAASTGGGPGDWASQLFNLASKAIPVAGQAVLLQTNITRAKAGLPPIDPATIAPQVQVGVAQPTLLAGGAGLLIIGAVVLGAVMLAKR